MILLLASYALDITTIFQIYLKINSSLLYRSEFFIVHDNVQEKQMLLKEKSVTESKCTDKALLKVIGYEACIKTSYMDSSQNKESPFFPLTGPATYSVILNKKDVPRGFKLLGKYITVGLFLLQCSLIKIIIK